MATFQVETYALTSAAGIVAQSSREAVGAQGGLSGAAGAVDMTPAAVGFSALVTAVDDAMTSTQDAVAGLSRALGEAAAAYSLAESSAAASMG
jgi:uncharacterized protein YukE